MTRILIDVPIDEAGLHTLQTLPGIEVSVCDPISEVPQQRDRTLIADQEVLFCATPPENLDDMPQLNWIQIASSGFEHLRPFDLPVRDIRASNARGVFDIPIAEWCLSMMVNLVRNLPEMFRNQQNGTWDRGAQFQTELRGRTVGFWGYGGLARETTRLAKQMGLHVHALTRSNSLAQSNIYCVDGTGDPEGILPDKVYSYDQKASFLQGLDFLVMGLPLNNQTQGIVTTEDLNALPTNAYVLNPARGPLIEESALLAALKDGSIAGAALDTHYAYPLPSEHPLWSLPNVIMTPHISGSTKSTRFTERVWNLFVQNVNRYVAGAPLLNQIDAGQLQPAGDTPCKSNTRQS